MLMLDDKLQARIDEAVNRLASEMVDPLIEGGPSMRVIDYNEMVVKLVEYGLTMLSLQRGRHASNLKLATGLKIEPFPSAMLLLHMTVHVKPLDETQVTLGNLHQEIVKKRGISNAMKFKSEIDALIKVYGEKMPITLFVRHRARVMAIPERQPSDGSTGNEPKEQTV